MTKQQKLLTWKDMPLLTPRLTTFAVAALALTGLAAARPAGAQTPITAMTYSSATPKQDPGIDFSLGYSFTTTNALDVTSLGYLNDGATGANAVHNVEIYQITKGTVLNPMAGTAIAGAAASVTTTAASSAYNTFSYTTLTAPVLLAADTEYEIVANSNGNLYGVNAQGVFFGGGIAYGTSTYVSQVNSPVFNTGTFPANNVGNFGPNFKGYEVSAAPEPSQFAVLGFAVLGIGGLVLKARRKTALAAA